MFYGRERERGKENDGIYCALSTCLTTRIIFRILSLVFSFGLINLYNTNILWSLFLIQGNHGLQSKSYFVSDNCSVSSKSILFFLPFAFCPWRIVDLLCGFLPFDFDQGENLTEDKKKWKRVMTILIFFYIPLCSLLLTVKYQYVTSFNKMKQVFWKWASLPNFLVDSEIDFHHFPFWVGAAMGFWKRDMHISERSWQSTNTFIPALDDNSHQPLSLGTQIIPLLFHWNPSGIIAQKTQFKRH